MLRLQSLNTWFVVKLIAIIGIGAAFLASPVRSLGTTAQFPVNPRHIAVAQGSTTAAGPQQRPIIGQQVVDRSAQTSDWGDQPPVSLTKNDTTTFDEPHQNTPSGNERPSEPTNSDSALGRRASTLALLSPDKQLNTALEKLPISSVRDLLTLSPEQLRENSGNRLSIDEAKDYRKKANVLQRLIDRQMLPLVVAKREPTRFEALSPELQAVVSKLSLDQERDEGETSACVSNCDGEISLFSPAVYLIYLLDFLERSFPTDLASLESIDQRFFQRFEELPTSQSAEFSDSYVRFTNQVLENYIASLEDPPRPWETPEQRHDNRVQIFDVEFRKQEYDAETGFNKSLVPEMFAAYLREMGTSTQNVRKIAAIPANLVKLREELAASQGLDLTEETENVASQCVSDDLRDGLHIDDLDDLASESVDLNALDSLRAKYINGRYGALYRWHWRKASREVAQELATLASDEKRTEFSKHLRLLRAKAIECVSAELQSAIEATEAKGYEQALSSVVEQAKECVGSGENCPKPKCERDTGQQSLVSAGIGCACDGERCGTIAGITCCEGYKCKSTSTDPDVVGKCVPTTPFACSYVGNPYSPPITPLRELFRHYADLFDAPEDTTLCPTAEPDTAQAASCAGAQLGALSKEIRTEVEQTVRAEEGLTSTDPQGPLPELTPRAERKIKQKVEEQLYSEYQLDRQFERLSREVITKDCTGAGRELFLDEVTRRADEAWRASVAKAESGFLSKIRTNLTAVALHKQADRVSQPGDRPPGTQPPGSGGSGDQPPPSNPEGSGGIGDRSALSPHSALDSDPTTRPPGQQPSQPATLLTEANIRALSDYLFMDLAVDESLRTTPLSAAIGRIHSLVQSVRLGTANRNLQGELIDRTNFDEEVWEWLQSYGIWHAAMMVSTYPENFLIPEIRTGTPQFESVSQSNTTTSLLGKVVAFRDAVDGLRSLKVVATVRAKGMTYVFAKPCCTPSMYYSVLDANGRWDLWRKVDGADTREGYAMYDGVYLEEFVFLFRMIDVIDDTGLWKFRVTVLPLKMNANGTLTSMAGTQGGEEGSTEESWQELGDSFELSGFGKLHFAVTNPRYLLKQRRTVTRSSIVAMNSSTNQIRFRRIDLSEPGRVSLDQEAPPAIYESIKNEFEDAAITEGLHKVDGYPGMLLWYIDGRLRLIDAEDMAAGGTGYIIPFNQDLLITPEAGTSAIRISDDETYIFYDAKSAADSSDSIEVPGKLHVVDVLSGSNQKGWSFKDSISLYVPDGDPYIQAGIYSNGTVSALVKPTSDDDKWKLYHVTIDNDSNLSLPRYQRIGRENPDVLYQLIREKDPARIYLDEFYLHLPMFLAARAGDSNQFAEAKKWLSWVFDPLGVPGKQERYPGSSNLGAGSSGLAQWLKDPFNPYSAAEIRPDIYIAAARIAHIENLLDWADTLFLRDTSESVNRARMLYEQASSILGDASWTAGGCSVDLRSDASAALQQDNASMMEDAISPLNALIAGSVVPKIAGQGFSRELDSANLEPSSSQPPISYSSLQSLLDRRKMGRIKLGEAEQLRIATLADRFAQELSSAFSVDGDLGVVHEFPQPNLGFCIPRNPLASLLRWKIDANLAKIRTNRNFAGIPRTLRAYSTPVDPARLVVQAAAGGVDFNEYIPSLPPPIYRYGFLLERAKILALSAQQLEGSAFSAVKEAEEAEYGVMHARQDVQLERVNVSLQALRVKEASDGKSLAEEQKKRAEHSRDHFQELVDGGLLEQEKLSLEALEKAKWSAGITVSVGIGSFGASFSPAAQLQAWATAAATEASNERRMQEWEFQSQLGVDDVAIADAGILVAEDRVKIAEQERGIAELRLGNSNDTVEFLQDRFANAALYRWMYKNLRRLYREQLHLAISTARAAQRALEFERQTSLDYISTDYWDEERAGLVGAERLLKDLDEMEQYRLSTATRKKEIEKTISLASLMPAEFQQFRNTGVLDFETQMEWFDHDFPGHYMRLVRDVSVSIVALIPPTEGVHATLSNPGISRVMTGSPWEQYSTIYRLPESVALSGASKATGLFELNANDPMLFPFEGNGVASTWRLEMPKGANRFDYNSLYDVLLTIRYTALDDSEYRRKVLDDLGQTDEGFVKTGAVRYFSMRNSFPDQWYQLLNPIIGQEQYWDPRSGEPSGGNPQLPYTMVADLKPTDFVPNEDRRRIKKVTLAMQIADGEEFENEWCVPISLNFGGNKSNVFAQLKNTQVTSEIDGFTGRQPYGPWVLAFGRSCDVGGSELPTMRDHAELLSERVQDLWLIVEYEASVHYNR